MNKIGILGVLEIDQDAGMILFHPDPRYAISTQPVVLTITDLPAQIPNPLEEPLVINHMQGQSWETRRMLPAVQTSLPVPACNPPMPLQVSAGAYADLLYPAVVLGIMRSVLAGEWDGGNPEKTIDTILALWIKTNIADLEQYVADLAMAVEARQCFDIVLARINAELIYGHDNGDEIVIMSDRKFRLFGEAGGPGHPINSLPMLSPDGQTVYMAGTDLVQSDDDSPLLSPEQLEDYFRDNYDKSFAIADQFYATCKKMKLREPKPSLSIEAREEMRVRLRKAGYNMSTDQTVVAERLEKALHERDFEQSTLARLLYLAIFEAFNGFDGSRALTTTLSQKRLAHRTT